MEVKTSFFGIEKIEYTFHTRELKEILKDHIEESMNRDSSEGRWEFEWIMDEDYLDRSVIKMTQRFEIPMSKPEGGE